VRSTYIRPFEMLAYVGEIMMIMLSCFSTIAVPGLTGGRATLR